MKISRLILVLSLSVLISFLLHQIFAGSRTRTTGDDTFTYWIGPISTTIPFVIWALFTLGLGFLARNNAGHIRAALAGYLTGWLAMTAFVFWIILLPKGPETSSTMGIALMFTPFFIAPIFPVFFLPGYIVFRVFQVLDRAKGIEGKI